jgi:predicted Zn-dependent protease
MKSAIRAILAGLTLAVLVAGCATVPETGRSQLRLVSSSEERQMGFQEFEKLKTSTPISHDAAATALVERVGRRIAAVAPLPNAKWEFVLFDEPKVMNAFCLPGGKVGVYSGILRITQDETGLATVIGHEVSHAVAHHGAERMSQALLVQLGGQLLATATQTQPQLTAQLWAQAYGVGTEVAYMLPHSRQQELEADHLGLLYMARAGYDPRGALAFWERFKAYNDKQAGQTPVFLRTHPLDKERIKQIQQLLPQAEGEYHKAIGH